MHRAWRVLRAIVQDNAEFARPMPSSRGQRLELRRLSEAPDVGDVGIVQVKPFALEAFCVETRCLTS